MVTQTTCKATCKSGRACRAPALPGEELCFTHSPTVAEARTRARRENGRRAMRAAAVLPDSADVQLRSTQDVLGLIEATATQIRRGQLDTKVGNCLCYLAATALRCISEGDLERRLAEVEAQLAKLREARHVA
jgi:hypothetical protein